MAYEKQNFIDSQTLKAEHLNHIEGSWQFSLKLKNELIG